MSKKIINITIGTINIGTSGNSAGIGGLLEALGSLDPSKVQVHTFGCDSGEAGTADTTAGSVFDAPEAVAVPEPAAPSLDIDEDEAEPSVATSVSDEQLNSEAFGGAASNEAKLQWALRRVVDEDGDLTLLSELVGSGVGYRELIELGVGNTSGIVSYGNLYRERDGYAKLGSGDHPTEARARSTATPSNLVAVVGLGMRKYA